MATFPNYTPEIGASRKAKPRWQRARFNDEIERAEVDSAQLQQIAREWPLRFPGLTRAQANEIDTFLEGEARANTAFLWTPPGPGFNQGAFRCSEWSKTFDSCRRAVVTATFREDWN
jgi:phage-related protein